jgi:hypothetical protein
MQHVFWMIQNQLAGRCGPDRQPWNLADLQAAGFGAILSLNDGLLCHPEDFGRIGLAYACIPLSPNAPPCTGDLDHCVSALPAAYLFVADHLAKGQSVLVHCSSGKDRTGLFLSYFLMQHLGQSAKQAMSNVLAARPIAFTATGWQEFVLAALTAAGPNNSFKPTPLRGAA